MYHTHSKNQLQFHCNIFYTVSQKKICNTFSKFKNINQAQTLASQAEKRNKTFDKVIEEWKRKVDELQNELENSQKESRGYSVEIYKLKNQIEETHGSMDAIQRENKNLNGVFFKIKNF